jgi:hypothetical protein
VSKTKLAFDLMLLFSVCPRGGKGGVPKKMLVILGRPKMHMIMKHYGKLKIAHLILFKMKIITISGTCKRNPIWVPKKDL